MPSTQASLEKRKTALVTQLENNLDFLIGSVVSYQLKCSKDCHCNKGKGHTCFYLSMKQKGKTRNLYLNKDLVEQARQMSHSYSKLKQILKEISQVNYELLRGQESEK